MEPIPEAGALRPYGFAIVHPRGDTVARRVLYAQSAKVRSGAAADVDDDVHDDEAGGSDAVDGDEGY